MKNRLDLAKVRKALPEISSTNWAIFDRKTMKFVHGLNDFDKVHPGYLTKMMTALTTVKLCQ
jgi:D-alanyl-D-alanine carboxypeptidase